MCDLIAEEFADLEYSGRCWKAWDCRRWVEEGLTMDGRKTGQLLSHTDETPISTEPRVYDSQ